MKKFLLFNLMFIGVLIFSQQKEFDKKITGCFKGSEQNQQIEGFSKYWVSCRLPEGKMILLFVAIDEDGNVQQSSENGSWWTKDGKYYENHDYDNVTDIYYYKALGNGDVEFKSIEILGRKDDTYNFTDYKTEDL